MVLKTQLLTIRMREINTIGCRCFSKRLMTENTSPFIFIIWRAKDNQGGGKVHDSGTRKKAPPRWWRTTSVLYNKVKEALV